jgi:exonuclease VII small subunit
MLSKKCFARPTTSIVEIPPVTTTSTSMSDVQETIEYLLDQCCNIVSETLVTSIPVESKRERKIIRLERRLSRLARIIRELEEKDMSLDEMAHCDLYEVESNLKKEACQVEKKKQIIEFS